MGARQTHGRKALGPKDGQPLIRMQQVVKTFHTPAGDFTALKGIDADFHRGEFVSIVGKSGSGKSTLVNMITGIDRPTAGEVEIAGTHIHDLTESERAKWRGRHLGIVFQFYQLLPQLSLLENVMLPMDFCNVYDPEAREARALDLLEKVGLADLADKMPAAVSGGQQQSAAIARALANDPPIIVADEPTGNLDSKAADAIYDIFEGLVQQGKTIVMVTHDTSLAERASRSLLLSDGEVIDEAVANALPRLSHRQMLHATKQLQARRYAPGEPILHAGAPNDTFYIVTDGYIDVTQKHPGGIGATEEILARMGPGQYFGEISLLHARHTTANVRAASETPVEVATLERATFTELMEQSQVMRAEIAQVAHARLKRRDLNRG
jgi:ABC-type lipoprotein export system ATPase subunit